MATQKRKKQLPAITKQSKSFLFVTYTIAAAAEAYEKKGNLQVL